MQNNKVYWKDKDKRIKHAQEHIAMLNEKYSEEIQNSIMNTVVLTEAKETKINHGATTNIRVLDMTTDAAVFAVPESHIAVLNFASYKNPGGMFEKGSGAQEEMLCHASTLYPVLKAFENSYYDQNRGSLNFGFYSNRGLYSKDIVFFADGKEPRKVDVITCAAPNLSPVKAYHPRKLDKNHDILMSRIDFVLNKAYKENPDVLILGAWGCGVFQQDAEEVANAFKDCLNHYNFKEVVFAVPSSGMNYNYMAFKQVFGG